MQNSKERIIEAQHSSLDNENITTLRPQNLEEFIGQTDIKGNLEVFIKAAKKKNTSLDHVLFCGPPGLGKTTLAHIIAKELNVNIYTTSGPLLTKAGDLAAIVTNLTPKDVLFIDEIHRLNHKVEEILYPAIEDFKLDLIVGSGPSTRTINIDIAKFTLIGATTKIGLISNPLRDRFGIPIKMNFYTIPEQLILLKRASKIMQINMNEKALKEIAKRARGTPRIALRILKRLHDFSLVKNIKYVTQEFTQEILGYLNIDNKGLDKADHEYMKYLYENGTVGINTISSALSEQKNNIEETIEPYLMKIGLIKKTTRGRILTEKGIDHVKSIKL